MSVNTEINKELVEYAYKNLKNIPKTEEYEKMISSVPYDCFNKDLWLRRNLAHETVTDYHQIRMKDYDYSFEKHQAARVEFLLKIFGSIQPDIVLEPPFYVDYGFNISIGKGFYGNFNLTFLDCTLITIGDYVMMAPGCTLTTATHPTDPTQRMNGVEYALPIKIGNGVWMGCNVTVLPGVTIGDGAVIGAGSTVNKDVPANTVVVGVPARVVRQLKPYEKKEDAMKEVS
ncbi:CIC11C00000001635 [Sungouiella intermedia]|uniref:Acetyltransferase n=1 Tax=Sungouiella intermedia TaxID=45354 RepID=A0A1L0BG49_9ASCO|nr:CIC11C00000001635 [[Candida] intermedia]SGZ52980.1 CIC11C00000003999 [[Candida] intermedia]